MDWKIQIKRCKQCSVNVVKLRGKILWIGNFILKVINNVEQKNLEEELKWIGHFKQKDINIVVQIQETKKRI